LISGINMANKEEKLKELLVGPGHLTSEQFDGALKIARERKRTIEDVLVDSEYIKDEQLGQLIAQDLGYRFVNLRQEKIDEQVLGTVPEIVARAKGVIAFARDQNGVKVGMLNPGDVEMLHFLAKRFGQAILPYFITAGDHSQAVQLYRLNLKTQFAAILDKLKSASTTKEENNSLIIGLVDTVLNYGYLNKASDIHLEPQRHKMLIRLRIDGVMHNAGELPPDLLELVIMRIKILSKMRTDEHRAAQDGKFQFAVDKETIDVRVSIVPVTNGENVVMRLLSAEARRLTLDDLGLSPPELKIVKRALKNPHGMILITGPTGSGKTTTIYELLKILNTEEVHIATIEDPVEYDLEGISQIQVNARTNLTFAKGLRAIVRQDPDIIMVGEIRDQETAGIAVNSAMTGHLVLSTLHANDAATTLPRLLDMGIEPFLVASTVNMVIAQRLVRRICVKCRVSSTLSPEEMTVIGLKPELKKRLVARFGEMAKVVVYRGQGCPVCAHTGYKGRIGVYEILKMSDEIKNLVLKKASSAEIEEEAAKEGMTNLLEDGVIKIINGATTLSEIIRVAGE
jgi:type II secretory ATPase GspE/PulE/Tfp pilus assembly ATPase PilB-like protein